MRWRGNPRGIIASTLFILLAPPFGPAQDTVTVDADSVIEYILSCRKPNGAFGPGDQFYTDAAWNYPAVAALKLLGEEIDRPEAILENGLGYPDGHVGYGHWQFFHYHKIRELLGEPIVPDHEMVSVKRQQFDEIPYYGSPFGSEGDTFFKAGNGPEPDPRDVEAGEFGYYNLASLYYLLEGLRASGRGTDGSRYLPSLTDRISLYQAKDGGFVDVRGKWRKPKIRESHVAHTFQAISILKMLKAQTYRNEPGCTQFLQNCQAENGGFRWQPYPRIPGNLPDIYYTWAAVKGLDLLEKLPKNEEACIAWINSLQNSDGGFGDQPGWRSRLYSTWYAVDTLATLTGGEPAKAITPKNLLVPIVKPIPVGRFQIYQGLNKIPVIEGADLAGLHDRGFNLLALKSDDFAMAESLRAAVRERGLPMDVVLCPEAYPHRARRHGNALLNHIFNPALDPGWTPEQRARWKAADAAGAEGLDWKDYQQQVIRPLRHLGSLVYPEQDFEMEYAYSAYDAGLDEVGGYNAILAGFNWAPRDFVRVFPWRERYVDKLTPIADCDAHGDLEKWSPQLDHTRHLFIAEGPSYRDFIEATRWGRVVCVIRNPGEEDPPATFYGRKAAVAYVKERIKEWKWW